MHAVTEPDDQIARIERRLSEIQILLEHQSITLANLQDEIEHLHRSSDWYNVQFSELIRILARDIRELRASLICSVISEGPINTQILQTLLRTTPEDERALMVPSQPPHYPSF